MASKTSQVRRKPCVSFFPVYALRVDESIGSEFRLNDVSFVSANKIPRIRKRLGIRHPISRYRNQLRIDDFLLAAPTYAVVRSSNLLGQKPDFSAEYQRAREALWLLCSSFHSGQARSSTRPSTRRVIDSRKTEKYAAFPRSRSGDY